MNSGIQTQDSNLSLARLEQLDRLSAGFEQAWREGRQPRVEEFLHDLDEPLRTQVFQELVQTEWELREQDGLANAEDYYINRFPEYAAFIRKLLPQFTPAKQQPKTGIKSPKRQDTDHATSAETIATAKVAAVATSLPAISDYEILQEIGRGGMGVVYRARHLALNRIVALKTIRDESKAGDEYRKRFQQEAEAVAQLQHPHIVQIYEVGETDGAPFFSLEYCDEGSLEDQLNGTPRPAPEAARLIETLACAIHSAHQKNIIHRDLKPANVLFTADRMAKITDFGLAKKIDQTALTQTGVIVGTPSYMAPEQAEGKTEQVGPKADVYALGAILYELLTGRPPFKSETPLDTVLQLLKDEVVPPSRLNAKIPRDLATICSKCLEKKPHQRFASALELAEDLRRFLDGKPILARRVSAFEKGWRLCRRYPRSAGLLALFLTMLIAIVILSLIYAREATRLAHEKTVESEKAKKSEKKAEENATSARRVVEQLYAAKGMSLADDGKLLEGLHWLVKPLRGKKGEVEFEKQHRSRFAAYWRFGNRPNLTRILQHPDTVRRAFFSSNGRDVVAIYSWYLLVNVWDGNTGKIIGSLPKGWRLVGKSAVSADGRLVLAVEHLNGVPLKGKSTQPRVWDIIRQVPASPPLVHPKPVSNAELSPDGKQLATIATDWAVRLWDSHTGKSIGEKLQHPAQVISVVFSPDGMRIATTANDGKARIWEVVSGQQLATYGDGMTRASLAHSFSPDGVLLITTGDRAAQIWATRMNKGVGLLLPHRDTVQAAAFSPDGKRAVTASADFSAKVWDVHSGQQITAPLLHQFFVHDAAFSTDGKFVITAGDDKTARIWNAATGQPVTPFLQHKAAVYSGRFGADGRFLTASGDGAVRVWQMSNNALGSTLPDKTAVVSARFSPDGRYVLTSSRKSKQVWDVATGRPIGPPLQKGMRPRSGNIFGGGGQAVFSSDSRHVILSGKETTRIQDIRSGRIVGDVLSHGPGGNLETLSANGRRVVLTRKHKTIEVWDVPTRRMIYSKPKPYGWSQESLSDDGGHLIIVARGRVLSVINVTTGRPVGPALLCKQTVLRALLGPHGRRLAAADTDHRVRVWSTITGKQIAGPFVHQRNVHWLAFSAAGRRLVTTSTDHSAQVWDVDKGKAIGPPFVHRDEVGMAAFSPDGRRVVTASYDKTARVWDVATGQPLTPPLGHVESVDWVAFSPDGQRIVTASGQKGRLWDLSADNRPAADLVNLVELYHGYRLDQFGALSPLAIGEQVRLLQRLQEKNPGEFEK